jgi:predicted 3-demethylubiquinone-9 3-methyltransferase (glyoxalase superfamily)
MSALEKVGTLSSGPAADADRFRRPRFPQRIVPGGGAASGVFLRTSGVTTMQKITPFLWFDGQAEAAARFYVSLFPDSRIDKVTRAPAESPSGPAGMVLTVEFTLAGTRFVGLNGGPLYKFTEAVSFHIACADQAEVDRLWAAFSEGGSDGHCGWIKDRWGLSWQIVPTRLHELLADPDPNRSRRAMQAMLRMNKINIAELERAADGP